MKPLVLAALIALLGCSSGPMPTTYVLGVRPDAVAGVSAGNVRPVVALRTVSLPDYLDTSEILVRDGRNELTASKTGRWGERLSVGIGEALVLSLTRRVPSMLITHSPVYGQPARDLLVEVEAFDVQPDGRCVLTARWSVLADDRRTVRSAGAGTFVTMAPATAAGRPDTAIVSAMADAVEQLAGRIAITLTGR